MPRRARVFVEGALYHVYNRFARGAELFREGEEAERFLEILRGVRDRDGWTVYAWCLMSNHYHLVVRTGPVPLARSMGHLQSRYAAAYNRRWRSTGPLWQSRYKAKLVETGDSLRRVIAYVHLNPVTAGVVDDPAEYPLSGHRELLRRRPSPLVDPETVLSIYGASVRSARRAYVTALEGVAEAGWRSELPGRLPWWRREPDRELAPPTLPAVMDEEGRTSGLEREDVGPEEFLEIACRELGCAVAELARPGKGREASRLRYLVAALAVERWRLSASAIARRVGRRPDVVSRWVRRGAELRGSDPAFRDQLDELDQALSEHFSRAAT